MNQANNLFAIGIDLGGTKLEVGLINQSGSLIHRELFPTKVKEGFQAVEKDIAEAVRQMQKKAEGSVTAVGIGMAGQIEAERGIVKFAPNLKWRDVPRKAIWKN